MNSRLVNLLDKLQLSEKTYITKDWIICLRYIMTSIALKQSRRSLESIWMKRLREESSEQYEEVFLWAELIMPREI